MPKVTFARNYDHTWPSRAVTAFKAGWSGTVKDEVAEAAAAAGVLEAGQNRLGRPPKPESAPLVVVEPATPITADDLRNDPNSQ